MGINDVNKNSDILGERFPRSVLVWSDKNETSPFDYHYLSRDEVFWKCQSGEHDDYKRAINISKAERFRCPNCVGKRYHPNTWNRLDLVGNQFGELTIVSFSHTKNGATYWNCKCSCGADVIKNGNDMRSGKIVTCGNRSIHRLGKDNSNWRDGATEKNYSERYSKEYAEWHKSVFERDNFTCQCCGQHSGKLEAHHIFDFASYENLRTDKDNGMTLCQSCHNSTIPGSFHYNYGTIGKTPEELEQYINNKRKQLGINIPFSIDSYLAGNILKPEDTQYNPVWIFDKLSYVSSKTNILPKYKAAQTAK